MNTTLQTQVKATSTSSFTPVQGRLLQRKCACGGTPGPTGECEACRKKREAVTLQRAANHTAVVNAAPPIVHDVLRSPGQLLDPATRAFMEPRFGHDFSRVRVNTDARAAGLAPRFSLNDRIQSLELSRLSTKPDESNLFESRVGACPSMGIKWTADIKTVRHSLTHKAASLSDSGEASIADSEDESIIKIAQAGAGAPASAPPITAAPTCTYSITYANLTTPGCSGGRCGAQIVYDVTRVTATGSGCPATLTGLRLTETVTTDEGCIPGAVTTGAGCPIGPGGAITGCTDTYAMCAPAASFPAAGCTERYTQRLFVGGVLAETRTITFRITRSGGACSGSVTRT